MLNLNNIGAIKHQIKNKPVKISFSWTKFGCESDSEMFNGIAKKLREVLGDYNKTKIPQSVYVHETIQRYMNNVDFSFSTTPDGTGHVEFNNLQQGNSDISVALNKTSTEYIKETLMTLLMSMALKQSELLDFIYIAFDEKKVSINELVATSEDDKHSTYKFGKVRKQELVKAIVDNNVSINIKVMKLIYSAHNFNKYFTEFLTKYEVEHWIDTLLSSSNDDIDVVFDCKNRTINFQSMSDPTVNLTIELKRAYKKTVKECVLYMLNKFKKREMLEQGLYISGVKLCELTDKEAFGKKLPQNIKKDEKKKPKNKTEKKPKNVSATKEKVEVEQIVEPIERQDATLVDHYELINLESIKNKYYAEELEIKEKRLAIEKRILTLRYKYNSQNNNNQPLQGV